MSTLPNPSAETRTQGRNTDKSKLRVTKSLYVQRPRGQMNKARARSFQNLSSHQDQELEKKKMKEPVNSGPAKPKNRDPASFEASKFSVSEPTLVEIVSPEKKSSDAVPAENNGSGSHRSKSRRHQNRSGIPLWC